MRTFGTRSARIVLATVAGISFAVLGAGAAFADGSATQNPQQPAVVVTPTPTTSATTQIGNPWP